MEGGGREVDSGGRREAGQQWREEGGRSTVEGGGRQVNSGGTHIHLYGPEQTCTCIHIVHFIDKVTSTDSKTRTTCAWTHPPTPTHTPIQISDLPENTQTDSCVLTP